MPCVRRPIRASLRGASDDWPDRVGGAARQFRPSAGGFSVAGRSLQWPRPARGCRRVPQAWRWSAGFGPNIYQGRDPRTRAMLKALERRVGHLEITDRFLRAIEAGRQATGLEPDFGLIWLAVTRLLGLEARDANILRLARFSGWIAHGLEQYREHDLVRSGRDIRGACPPSRRSIRA